MRTMPMMMVKIIMYVNSFNERAMVRHEGGDKIYKGMLVSGCLPARIRSLRTR